MPQILRCGRHTLDLSRPRIMGVVNVTPDSFSDGGRHMDAGAALAHAERLIEEGADLLDVGGESSRPGAQGVSADEELRRILPLLKALRDAPVPVAVDTVKPEVMRAAIAEGASMINDINALRAPGALAAVTSAEVGVCLMHMQGEPRSMQADPKYEDVVAEVKAFLAASAARIEAAGVRRERIVLDPGFGFGKKVHHNLQLLRELEALRALGYPLLAGLSRKHTLGVLTGRPVTERVVASVAAALVAVRHGALIVRVHDVAATRDALAVWNAVEYPSVPG
jgi:dihydropteroate synthase